MSMIAPRSKTPRLMGSTRRQAHHQALLYCVVYPRLMAGVLYDTSCTLPAAVGTSEVTVSELRSNRLSRVMSLSLLVCSALPLIIAPVTASNSATPVLFLGFQANSKA